MLNSPSWSSFGWGGVRAVDDVLDVDINAIFDLERECGKNVDDDDFPTELELLL